MASLRRFCQLSSYRQGTWVFVITGLLVPLLVRGLSAVCTWLLKSRQGRQLPMRNCRSKARAALL